MIHTQAYAKLTQHIEPTQNKHLKCFFDTDQNRFEEFHARMPGLLFDYSKQKIDQPILELLIELAKESELNEWIEKQYSGEAINITEGRAALHTALRNIENPMPQVAEQWEKMQHIVDCAHSGQLRGFSGKPITDVINIGVGGSDLGPLMITRALEGDKLPTAPGIHFVSTLDAHQLQELLNELEPETTVFIIASKSFTTIDTLSLAETSKKWIQSAAKTENATMHHFIAASTNVPKMTEWGILPKFQLHFWDWVGGRFSLWSSIGLSIALHLGMQGYKDMLAGAYAMDQHYKNTPFAQNIPVLLGLIGVWNTNFLDRAAQAILPYDSRLKYFSSYLEQLEMESNGKRTKRDGTTVEYRTCPILWGEVGPNAQHAFYQLMHQGTEKVMADFILFKEDSMQNERSAYHHNLNIANCLAQSRALMIGQTSDNPHQFYPGDQVSNTLLMDKLDAYHLGMLVALYEHKVFTESVIWKINPFDQWGVELGKRLAMGILDNIQTQNVTGLDSSTAGILNAIWNKTVEQDK
ncbi:glucose-6-phosphate isomerase [Thiomicrorhabdus aquaedulcis]|uniref:glucose-6-phosphate isomerase n=1 Tax=Thiomicrorhabdus aquaedulcis TaxID=2211106 RepID=UPI000FDA3008|nr:glucose-6-phosphate isomerase [Thiomicrorhabdus aquaedulcis]